MAQNIFAREDNAEPVGGKLKKKKKPKKSPFRKKEEDIAVNEESNKLQDDDFNPYALDDPL